MAEAKFTVAKEKRTILRRAVTNEVKKAADFAEITSDNVQEAATYKAKIERLQSDLLALDELVACQLTAKPDDLIDDIERSQEYQNVLVGVLGQLSYNFAEYSAERQQASSSAAASGSPTPQSYPTQIGLRGARHKLLDVDVMKFRGEATEWEEFWDDFISTVDSKMGYTSLEKFKILKGSLEGEPARMIKGLLLTNANYEQAKKLLEERYDNKQRRRFGHLESLMAMPPSDHSIVSLRNLRDEWEASIRSLVALGMDEIQFGEVFILLLLTKLPKYVRLEISRKQGTAEWTLRSLRELLKTEIDIRENCEKGTASYMSEKEKRNSKRKGPGKPTDNKGAESTLLSSSEKPRDRKHCAFCEKGHESYLCQTYPDVISRRHAPTKVCWVCLERGHPAFRCKKGIPCQHCKSKGHHHSLCPQKYGGRKEAPKDNNTIINSQSDSLELTAAANTGCSQAQRGRAILETAVATVSGEKSQAKSRVIFDTASTLSFVTTSLAKKIGAKFVREQVSSVGRFKDDKRKAAVYRVYEVDVFLLDGSRKSVEVFGVATICTPVSIVPLAKEHRSVVSTLTLAEPLVENSRLVDVDILIGLNAYHIFVEETQIRLTDTLVLKRTLLGWIASGYQVSDSGENGDSAHVILAADVRKGETFDVERFWALDEIGIKDDPGSADDEVALRFFNETIQFVAGRYMVKWPFKDPHPNLPTNERGALRRLKSLWSRIKDQPGVLCAYDQVFKEQLSKHMIEVAPKRPDGLVHYLPHHGVVKESSATTKLRVVFDASAKASRHSPSLNDCLYRGPVLMSDLCGILVRCRVHPIGLLSDVEKAYLQVSLQVEDRDVTRFFWFKNLQKGLQVSNLVCYRSTRVLFGVRPSAFMLSGTLAVHIRRSDKPVAADLDQNIYVDNSFVGKLDEESAIAFYREAKALLAEASMNLREWFSNSEEVLQSIPEVDRGKGEVTQLLGLKWHVKLDKLSSQPKLQDVVQPVTKRAVLKSIASVFDPCGWFCPLIVTGRILMQDLWVQKCDWDSAIPDALMATWNEVWQNITAIADFRVPRCVDSRTALPESRLELHSFCDASARAYASAVYLRVENRAGTSVSLLFAKARVSPARKQLTIPRLELMAVLIGLRLLSFVAKELRLPIRRKCVWSDSKCTLHWIHSKSLQTIFVENRLREIRKSLGDVEFRYVPTKDNPADIPSRGADAGSLKSEACWWNGPIWLAQPDMTWPENIEISEAATELRDADQEIVTVAVAEQKRDCVLDIRKFSDLRPLLRKTALVMRFVNALKGHKPPDNQLTASELEAARKYWIRLVQEERVGAMFAGCMSAELKNLKSQLGLYVDGDGIVRCSGRLSEADRQTEHQHPIFLPRDHYFTELVILRAHARVMHFRTAATLAEIRNQYWIPRPRNVIKALLKECKLCRLVAGGPFRIPDPPVLPLERVTASPPFTVTGIDYAGPFYVTIGGEKRKVWVALFTCAVIRAIHLEVVESLSAADFLLSFRRFVAARGAPKLVISDNALQFRLSKQLFAREWSQAITSVEVKGFSSSSGIEWKFIPECAPWFGGFYERMVKLVKDALKKTGGLLVPPMKEFTTTLQEIAAMINNRPLTYIEDEVGDRPLSPNDFLRVTASSLPHVTQESIFALGRRPTAHQVVEQWGKMEKQLDRCWKDWRNKYLAALRQQYWKHFNRGCSGMVPKVGTVVLIKDQGPRHRWRMGRITGLRLSRDNVCRSVELRLSKGNRTGDFGPPQFTKIVRPIKLLYPLEYSAEDEQSEAGQARKETLRKHAQVVKERAESLPAYEEQGELSDSEGSVEY